MSSRRFRFRSIAVFLLILLMIRASSVYASAPLMHMYAAQKWMEQYENYREEEKRSFYCGNLFPDIRYLAGIQRSSTHWKKMTVEEVVAEKNPFYKGMKLHSLVDRIQHLFYQKNNHCTPLNGLSTHDQEIALKFLEDENVLYILKATVMKEAVESLAAIHPEELKFGASEKDIGQWHTMLRSYLCVGPYAYFKTGSLFGTLSVITRDLAFREVKKLRHEKWLIQRVNDLLKDIDRTIVAKPSSIEFHSP